MLSVLKQADVVMQAERINIPFGRRSCSIKGSRNKTEITEDTVIDTEVELDEFTSEDEIIFAYCTEFIIKIP